MAVGDPGSSYTAAGRGPKQEGTVLHLTLTRMRAHRHALFKMQVRLRRGPATAARSPRSRRRISNGPHLLGPQWTFRRPNIHLGLGYVKRLVRGEGTRVPAEGPRRGCPGGLRGSTLGGYLGKVSSGGPTRAAGPSPLKGPFKLLQPTRVCFQRAGCKGPYSMLPVRPPSTMMRQAKPPW